MKKTNIPEFFPYNGQTCFLEGSLKLIDYLHGGFENELRDIESESVMKRLMDKYGIPLCGRNRATFVSSNFVIKFPLNDDGEINNSTEALFKSEKTAKGKLIILNNFNCLIQEKLKVLSYPLEDISIFPEWVQEIDSNQVGYDKFGVLKAYDFAEDVEKLKSKKLKFKVY